MRQFVILLVIIVVMLTIQITIKSRQMQRPLSVVTNYWVGYEPLYVAREFGAYNPRHIKLIEQQNLGDVVSAFKNRLVDAAAVRLHEALILSTTQDDFSIVLIFDFSNGADAIVAHKSITSVAELQNKRIGLEPNGISRYLFHSACELNSLKMEKVESVRASVDEHLELLENKSVDAVVAYEPFVTQFERLGYHKIFTSKEIPFEIVDVLIVRDSLLKEKKRYMKELINGYFMAVDFMKNRDKQAIDYIVRRLNIGDSELDVILDNIVMLGREENLKHFHTSNHEDCKQRVKTICKTLTQEINIDKCESKYKLFNNPLLQRGMDD